MQSMPWWGRLPERVRKAAGVIGVLWAGLACGEAAPEAGAGSDLAGEAPSAPSAEAPASPSPEPADTASWSVGIVSAPSTVSAPPLPVLTALRAGTHPEFARVTFEIGGSAGRPGYELEYVDRPLMACGSGEQIFPVGDGWLEVRLEPAAAHTEAGQPTLGPREVAVDGSLLQRIYRTCDFEGVVTHVLALGSPNEYRVFTLADPLRIVVDVRR